jgi:hypothetical protein
VHQELETCGILHKARSIATAFVVDARGLLAIEKRAKLSTDLCTNSIAFLCNSIY